MDNTNNDLINQVEQTENVIDTEEARKEAEIQKRGKRSRNIFFGVVGTAIVLYIIAAIIAFTAGGIDKEKTREYQGNIVQISTYADILTYQPKHVTVNLGDYNAEFDIDISDTIVLTTDIYDDYAYIVYMAEDSSSYTEIIVSKEIPSGLTIDETVAEQLHKESDEVFAYTELNEETGIVTGKAFTSLEELGMLAVIQQSKTDVENIAEKMCATIKECTLYSKNEDNMNKPFFLEVEGLGIYDVNELSFMDKSAGIYFGQDMVCRLYNTTDECEYAWITYGNNQYMMNYTTNMIQADGWNNLYYDKDKDNAEMMGYRAFGIQTPKGYYYIKMSENAPIGAENEIIEWLGIKADDEKVDFIGGSQTNE